MIDLDLHLSAIVAGDADAFARWLAGSEATVRLSLASFAAVVDVEAVLQEALVRVWQVAPRFVADGAPNGLVRLAIRIARNLAVSELRRTKTRPVEPGDLEDHLDTVRPIAPDPMLRAKIIDCRDKLPAKPRQALDARLDPAGDRDDTDLAAAVGMRLNTFLQNFARARKLLAECLQKHGVVIDQELGT
jgi:DNA-directed RNA polymerase specialized sigma24 family protein